jgi:hypothetical protein
MHFSIFTTKKCATAYFQKKTNNFSKHDLKQYEKFLDTVFHHTEFFEDGMEIKTIRNWYILEILTRIIK